MTSEPQSFDDLAQQHCKPCRGIPPVAKANAEKILTHLSGWKLQNGQISKEYKFSTYLAGLQFAFDVGQLAEKEDHHPEILVKWRKVRLTFWTHSINGLSMNDFIMAAKVEKGYSSHAI